MQLKPAQLVGVGLVVVVGAVFAATTLLQPQPEQPVHPDVNAKAEAAALARLSPPSAASAGGVRPNMPADATSAGSAEAKDDLYCQGLIFAAHRAAADPADPKDRRRILLAPALASAGADKLIKEGVATRDTTAIFADAHTDVAMADFAKGRSRISLAACEARAEAALSALGK